MQSSRATNTRTMAMRLKKDFYARDTVDVAREMLGRILVHRLPNGRVKSGLIVETEAYLGVEDPACHSFNNRRTKRTEPMFGEPGTSYIYFIYGVYFCFNVVTVARDVPEAVLVRALEPLEGLPPDPRIASGPGKLCIALELGREQNGLDLSLSNELWLEDGAAMDGAVIDGARVGIGNSHDAVHWPLRFGLKGNPCMSPPKFTNYLQ